MGGKQSKGEDGWPGILPTGEILREPLSIARDSGCLGGQRRVVSTRVAGYNLRVQRITVLPHPIQRL